jgi:hypothetical protein
VIVAETSSKFRVSVLHKCMVKPGEFSAIVDPMAHRKLARVRWDTMICGRCVVHLITVAELEQADSKESSGSGDGNPCRDQLCSIHLKL